MFQIDQREDWLSRIDAALASFKREAATMARNDPDSKRTRGSEDTDCGRASQR